MLQSANDLFGFRLFAADDEAIGVVTDLLFDERVSVTRYLVIEPEAWLPRGDLLIAPPALRVPDVNGRRIDARLPRHVLETAPRPESPGAPRPDEEVRLHAHFGWRPYWAGEVASGLLPYWGAAGAAQVTLTGEAREQPGAVAAAGREKPLRSARKVIGFWIEAQDGGVGRIDDLILDLATWTFRYLVVDTSGWVPGRRVLVSPQWLRRIDWAEHTVALDLPVAQIESSPAYDRGAVLDRRFEEMLHEHVDRPGYW